jgi:hypothetical protein
MPSRQVGKFHFHVLGKQGMCRLQRRDGGCVATAPATNETAETEAKPLPAVTGAPIAPFLWRCTSRVDAVGIAGPMTSVPGRCGLASAAAALGLRSNCCRLPSASEENM